jgi:hypothetical protein
MSDAQTCATCPARLAADSLELQAQLAEEVGAASTAVAMRKRAAEVRAAGCSWWWRLEEENDETGQRRTREACGISWLPMFLRSLGMDVARAASTITRDQRELAEMNVGFREALAATALAQLPAPVRVVRELGDGRDGDG